MIISLLSKFPCWWYLVTLALVVFHCGRGMIGTEHALRPTMGQWPKKCERIWVHYAHDILLHFTCTVFGAGWMLVAIKVAEGGVSQLISGGAGLLVISSLLGIAGITGQLAYMLSLGKFPWHS